MLGKTNTKHVNVAIKESRELATFCNQACRTTKDVAMAKAAIGSYRNVFSGSNILLKDKSLSTKKVVVKKRK